MQKGYVGLPFPTSSPANLQRGYVGFPFRSGIIKPPLVSLPTATTTVLGGVKVDGATVTISSGVISAPAASPLMPRSARSSNTALSAGDRGAFIDNSGTWTQTFVAAATLGSGWHCYLRNGGTGDITVDPNGSELIDGLTSYVMYPGETRLVQCDGAQFFSIVMSPFMRRFIASAAGGFVKPPGYSMFSGFVWGAGGGALKGPSGYTGYYAGGGGGCSPFSLLSSSISTTTDITVGAGGQGSTVSGNVGSDGGMSCFGPSNSAASVFATGGTGTGTGGGVNGAPAFVTGDKGMPAFNGGGQLGTGFVASIYGGSGVGGVPSPGYLSNLATFSLFGGAGGGVQNSAGGTSVCGGSGGRSNDTSSGADGLAPGGGGGTTNTGAKGGDGARGEVRIWGIV